MTLSRNTDAIGCSRLLQIDTARIVKRVKERNGVANMGKQSIVETEKSQSDKGAGDCCCCRSCCSCSMSTFLICCASFFDHRFHETLIFVCTCILKLPKAVEVVTIAGCYRGHCRSGLDCLELSDGNPAMLLGSTAT